MLNDRFLDLLRNLFVQVGTLFVAYFYCSTASSCHILIQSNDATARVSINGYALGVVPQKIDCLQQDSFVMVQSRLGQKFSRVLPAKENFDPRLHANWSVNFPLHAIGEEARTLVANTGSFKSDGSELSNDQHWMAREISSLKQQIRNLNSKPAVQRRMSSVETESKKLRGWYLQLHSFKEDSWDMPSIASEVGRIRSKGDNQGLQVCFKNVTKGNPWTRVYLGPFQSEDKAKAVSAELQRQTLLVADPSCQLKE